MKQLPQFIKVNGAVYQKVSLLADDGNETTLRRWRLLHSIMGTLTKQVNDLAIALYESTPRLFPLDEKEVPETTHLAVKAVAAAALRAEAALKDAIDLLKQ